jgi:uncharacterized membrane protein
MIHVHPAGVKRKDRIKGESMIKFVVAYAAAAVWMLGLDFIWLSTMADRLYRQQLGDLLAQDFRVFPALAFYALYLFGLTYFAAAPAMKGGGWGKAALNGALLGVVAYGTYDLTNQATLRHWPVLVTMLDLLWGAFLTATSATFGYAATVLSDRLLGSPTSRDEASMRR